MESISQSALFVVAAILVVAVAAVIYSHVTDWWPETPTLVPDFGSFRFRLMVDSDLRAHVAAVGATVVDGGALGVTRDTVEVWAEDGGELLLVTFGRGRQLFMLLSQPSGKGPVPLELAQYWFSHGPEYRAWEKLDHYKAVLAERARQRASGEGHELWLQAA